MAIVATCRESIAFTVEIAAIDLVVGFDRLKEGLLAGCMPIDDTPIRIGGEECVFDCIASLGGPPLDAGGRSRFQLRVDEAGNRRVFGDVDYMDEALGVGCGDELRVGIKLGGKDL